jgi:mannose-6-phosphate isomerase-like protein (cupin superfamily)
MAFKGNIEKITRNNNYYRRVLYTTKESQLVVMSLLPFQDIGSEIHPKTTQFIKVEGGSGISVVNNKRYILRNGNAIMIPSGARHNITAGSKGLKLYTIYSPPEHNPSTLIKHKMII